ncbi:serine carboxypeptidase [Patellaria atrata CBS 101060]|uniref:Carboxypeptidase n=1 Tax=Patellaria atrata CBS 101060 TaxID=1346257 RepID=A0A9P4VUB0_9PEZI|nr:serine carboxypeptidase [Patellaria atrata CBS 101060]
MRCLQLLLVLLAIFSFLTTSTAQYPPSVSNTTRINSPINPNISIIYKSPDPGTCTTVFDAQKQFTGYVRLPPFTLAPIQQNYSINTFFWFIEAREDPESAPLTIWLNGGPGSSSLIGLFQETGPCEVVQMADGSYGTQARLWGWDRSSNILFVDQPAQVGLSYDSLHDKTVDLIQNKYFEPPIRRPAGAPSWNFLNGTFSSDNPYSTTNTSEISAHAIWHFLQGFLSTFPQYNPGTRPNATTTSPTGVNLFAESYGGMYGPIFADLFEEKNRQRLDGTISLNNTLEIRLVSLGIINGCVDDLVQGPFYPRFAFNNTYGIQTLDNTGMINTLYEWSRSGGCQELLRRCRAALIQLDPEGQGDIESVNTLCRQATNQCYTKVTYPGIGNKSPYDIRQDFPSPFPPSDFLEYLNTAQVQKSIGTPLNFTMTSGAVYEAFAFTGDHATNAPLPALARLLASNIRIAFVYGDADYICNWLGGEAISFSLADAIPTYMTAFPAAGYADIIVNSSYIGGAVRQYGNLSFSRIYDAGHLVPAYQPETAFTVFTRIITGTDIGTGETVDLTNFRTTGPRNATFLNSHSEDANRDPVCWVRDFNSTCDPTETLELIAQNKGVVLNGILFEDADDYEPPASSVRAGVPGSPILSSTSFTGTVTSTIPPTGVYVATATAKPTRTGSPAVRSVVISGLGEPCTGAF